MATLTYNDIISHHPDTMLPPHEEFTEDYWAAVAVGKEVAAEKRIAIVGICRNAMPFLELTVGHMQFLASAFKSCQAYIFENDSTDGTKEFLSSVPGWIEVESRDNGRPHLNYTKTSDRTVALAEYRNRCRDWVASNAGDVDLVIVLDMDPWGGWSRDGLMTTVGMLESKAYADAAGMASYSWCQWGPPVWAEPIVCQYDAWACRLNHWVENPDMRWFHFWHPPVGSPPVKMNSAFGQLAVYRRENFLRGIYQGGDCEHVHHWRSAGGSCFLNPSQRVVSFWIPSDSEEQSEADLRSDILADVAGRNSDPDHR
jgi:hypothetical protein